MALKRWILILSDLIEKPLVNGELIDGRYLVLRHLGSGSYGHSYFVFDHVEECNLVLKALRFHKRIFKSGLRNFENEIQILKSFNHLGYPKFYQYGSYRRIPYFTMEFIEGKNFEQLIFDDGKKYSEFEVWEITLKLLEQIKYLHSNWIIHRDIRIPNVITDGSSVKLIDFGLARHRIVSDKDRKSLKKRRLHKQIDVQSDFYQLGHFILFLLYSNFTAPITQKERSWEIELELTLPTKLVLKKLLLHEIPYDSCIDIEKDILEIIRN
jgi:serine/threonine protein kinase